MENTNEIKWERISGEKEYFEKDNIGVSILKNEDRSFLSLFTITHSIIVSSEYFNSNNIKPAAEILFKLFQDIIVNNEIETIDWVNFDFMDIYATDKFGCHFSNNECSVLNENGRIMKIYIENESHKQVLSTFIQKIYNNFDQIF